MTTLAARLAGRRVIVCAGAGGVGKTTTSAAIAIALAAAGGRVAVVTIDPARRLADALGLDRLENRPRRVDPARFARHGVAMRGELWAMMLDAKRTFDELVERLAPDEAARDEILGNRIYVQLSNAVAGSQELTAVAKLHELAESGAFDAIVLDTPPSRHALDFLDAPDRLLAFLDGRALRVLLAPSGFAARVASTGAAMVFGILRRITGADLLRDLETFFRALSGAFAGFRARAAAVRELLSSPETAFVVVASPSRPAVDEAAFFAERLRDARLQLAAVVVNRVHPVVAGGADERRTTTRLTPALGGRLAARVARAHADVQRLARHDTASVARLRRALADPDVPMVLARDLERDVHDVAGLLALHDELFAAGRSVLRRAEAADGAGWRSPPAGVASRGRRRPTRGEGP